MTDTPQCKATSSRTGERCRNRPIRGGEVCSTHGGMAPQVQAKAAERLLQIKAAGEVRKRGWEPVTDPVGMLQDAAGEALAWLDLCRELLGDLHRIDYSDLREVQDVKPAIALYERSLDRVAKTAADMVRLGIEAKVARDRDAAAVWLRQVFTLAVEAARAEPEVAADVLLLRLIGPERSGPRARGEA